MKRIYFVNGFLEAGKTTFIKDLLCQEYFDTDEKTLLLLCEEGEEEYEETFCKMHNITLKTVETEAEFSENFIRSIENEVHPDRIIVEYNGLWEVKNKTGIWENDELMEIVIIDAQEFELYLNNLKMYVIQQVQNAYMVIFRSCDGKEDKLSWYRRNIRAVNSYANFVFKNKDGEMNLRFEEDLPYDLKHKYIDLNDDIFGIFYIDVMEYVKRYIGKLISFTGYIFKRKKNMLLIGRQVMTCCMEDLAKFVFICDISDTEEDGYSGWVKINGLVEEEYFENANKALPIIKVLWIENCQPPEQQIINVN